MMMLMMATTTIRKLLVSAMAAMLCNACVNEIPIDPKETSMEVVNCVLTNDTLQTLSLTYSVKVGDGYLFREVVEAEIVLQEDEGAAISYFEKTGYGTWHLKYQPLAGITYRLIVRLADGKELSATTTMPGTNRVAKETDGDDYLTRHFRQRSAEFPCWIFSVWQKDLPDNLIHPRPSVNASIKTDIGSDHPLIDRFNQHGGLSFTYPEATTPAYYYYMRLRPSFEIDEEGIPFCVQTAFGLNDFVCFRNASREYDNYLKSSLQKLLLYSSEEDPIQWFDEIVVYSNIENGTGIFAAYNDQYFFYFQ